VIEVDYIDGEKVILYKDVYQLAIAGILTENVSKRVLVFLVRKTY
jgi:hypothetical protein